MASLWFYASILFSFTLFYNVSSLEIIIGGGEGSSPPSQPPSECPSPPPPPPICPPPPSPKPSTPKPPPTPSPPIRSISGPINDRLLHDQRVILRFKKILESDPFNISSNWTPDRSPCNYRGFNCAFNPLHKKTTLSDVQFNGKKLKAPLKNFIDQLRDISIFHANSNNFHGEVPPISSSSIPFLFELDLSNNQLTGEFPTQVLSATNLTFLDLRFNNFQKATVPKQVFKLDVDVLFINNNNFPPQPLPLELGFTPALYLTLANNQFFGPIPYTIGEARKTLLEVLFLNNNLSGCLPWQIGLLKLARVFDVSINNLHGPIPSSFACLENMQILNMRHNQLDGVVPEMLCALPKLSNLTLSDNYFTEVGPNCRELIRRKVLDIRNNCISGLEEFGQPQRMPYDCNHFFDTHPRAQCPYQYLHAPCPAAAYGNRGAPLPPRRRGRRGRRAAEVGPATYGALNQL